MKVQEGDTPFAAAGGRTCMTLLHWKKLLWFKQIYIKMMVKLLSGKMLHTPRDNIPQKSTSTDQGRSEIQSIWAKGKLSDKHIYQTFFMPMCMLESAQASWYLSVSARRNEILLKFDLLCFNNYVWHLNTVALPAEEPEQQVRLTNSMGSLVSVSNCNHQCKWVWMTVSRK